MPSWSAKSVWKDGRQVAFVVFSTYEDFLDTNVSCNRGENVVTLHDDGVHSPCSQLCPSRSPSSLGGKNDNHLEQVRVQDTRVNDVTVDLTTQFIPGLA